MKMSKSQLYYYEDVVFQLELNLQNTRNDLVQLLEECKFYDCFACNHLCELRSTTVSLASSDSAFPSASKSIYYIAAPPADTLPTPRWIEKKTSNEPAKESGKKESPVSLNNWIRASIPDITQSTSTVGFPVPRKVLDHVNYSWPPFPKSIWSDERLKETTTREQILCCKPEGDGNSSVEAFFKYFREN